MLSVGWPGYFGTLLGSIVYRVSLKLPTSPEYKNKSRFIHPSRYFDIYIKSGQIPQSNVSRQFCPDKGKTNNLIKLKPLFNTQWYNSVSACCCFSSAFISNMLLSAPESHGRAAIHIFSSSSFDCLKNDYLKNKWLAKSIYLLFCSINKEYPDWALFEINVDRSDQVPAVIMSAIRLIDNQSLINDLKLNFHCSVK